MSSVRRILSQDSFQYNCSVNTEAQRQEALEVDRLSQNIDQYDESDRNKRSREARENQE